MHDQASGSGQREGPVRDLPHLFGSVGDIENGCRLNGQPLHFQGRFPGQQAGLLEDLTDPPCLHPNLSTGRLFQAGDEF